jgi:hypothetical protein
MTDYKEYAKQMRENAVKNEQGNIVCNLELWEEIASVIERAIIPPCKVGDIVYTIFEGDIEALKVTYTKTEESVEFVYRYYDAKNKFLNMPFSDRCIGKTVFLTKEEAEEKLKELGK